MKYQVSSILLLFQYTIMCALCFCLNLMCLCVSLVMPEQLNIQKEESKKKEVHVEDNVCRRSLLDSTAR